MRTRRSSARRNLGGRMRAQSRRYGRILSVDALRCVPPITGKSVARRVGPQCTALRSRSFADQTGCPGTYLSSSLGAPRRSGARPARRRRWAQACRCGGGGAPAACSIPCPPPPSPAVPASSASLCTIPAVGPRSRRPRAGHRPRRLHRRRVHRQGPRVDRTGRLHHSQSCLRSPQASRQAPRRRTPPRPPVPHLGRCRPHSQRPAV